MYTFQATMILLYVLTSKLDENEQVLANVETSLKIFEAMDASSVARKCAKRTKEMFDAVKSRMSRGTAAFVSSCTGAPESLATPNSSGDFTNVDHSRDDFWGNLIDLDVLEIFGSNVDILGSDTGLSSNSDTMWGGHFS